MYNNIINAETKFKLYSNCMYVFYDYILLIKQAAVQSMPSDGLNVV